jgi:hypothetical protein
MLPGMLLNLCQIANSLTEQCEHETFQISGFWADDGQTAPYCPIRIGSDRLADGLLTSCRQSRRYS